MVLFLSFSSFLDTPAVKNVSHHQIVERYADTKGRQQGQCVTYYSLEDGHDARLQSHIHGMTRHKAYHITRRGFLAEGKIGGKNVIEHKTDAITYKGRGNGLDMDGVDKHYIDTVLQACCYCPYYPKPYDFGSAPFSGEEFFRSLYHSYGVWAGAEVPSSAFSSSLSSMQRLLMVSI